MERWGVGATGFVSRPIWAACLLLAALLLGVSWAHAASGPGASGPAASGPCGSGPGASGDVSERAAQSRTLLDTPQGTTLLHLLGDPAVRERLLAAPFAPPPPAAVNGSMGFLLNRALGDTRQRIIDLGTELRALPNALRACWDRVSATMPASATLELLVYLVAFVAGGLAAQRLFLLAARPWLAHFNLLDVTTLEHRLAVLVERLAFGILLLGIFVAGSMGTFLLFSWPASSGSMILGYLWATVEIRLSHTRQAHLRWGGSPGIRFGPGAPTFPVVALAHVPKVALHRWYPGSDWT